jgi:chitinase
MSDHQQTDRYRTVAVPLGPPKPELSRVRVGLLALVLAGLCVGAWQLATRSTPAAEAKSNAVPVYAPYVDVTQTPMYPFQLPSANPVSSVYLAFVVSSRTQPCAPSWGDYYSLDQAEQTLDLDARAAQLRKEGGSVMISYGGRDNTELAVGCTNAAKLVAAYRAPLERYHASTIDLDLEGATLGDAAANARRAAAIATLQKQFAARHTALRVWLTLPVSRSGLTADGIAAVRSMLAAHVTLAGVNAMAMDYGLDEHASGAMLRLVEASLTATQAQVLSLWRSAGLAGSQAAAWGHVGATVMLGVNESPDEQFTTDDAQSLAHFVSSHGIPRVSAWSLNRDAACGGAFAQTGIVSNTCSGVLQKPLQFTKIFGNLRGTRIANAETAAAPTQAATGPVDDPATSPYPIWRSTAAYGTGYKVVWQHEIYQASWWTQGTAPDAGASSSGPWQPIGPVPAGSHAPRLELLVHGAFPQWSPTAVYRQGDRVTYEGLPYQARWYTEGDQPLANLPADPGAPWQPLFKAPGEPTAVSTGAVTH